MIETESMSFQQLVEGATALYLKYGKFGERLLSDDAEHAITIKADEVATYSLDQMRNEMTILQALNPDKEAEAQRLAASFYTLVVESLPEGAIART